MADLSLTHVPLARLTAAAAETLSETTDGRMGVAASIELRADGSAGVHVIGSGCNCDACRASIIAALRKFADEVEAGATFADVDFSDNQVRH